MLSSWAALLGGPTVGAMLVMGYIVSRFGQHAPIGFGALALHVFALSLLLLAIPATVTLRQQPEVRRPLIAAWILWVLPCGAWISNSLGVVVKSLLA